MEFTELIDLAAEKLGATVLEASDDFFAEKENLLKPTTPIFIEGKYTDRGKWMDGWESRRKRVSGHDWCLIRLGLPGIVRGVVVDTAFFRGNFPSHCSIEGCWMAGHPTVGQLLDPANQWVELLPKVELQGDSKNPFSIAIPVGVTHLRFNIFPDGGVARLRVYGDVVPDWKRLLRGNRELDLAAVENGGVSEVSSDMFFGSRHNLIMPGFSPNMGDGWETKRRRGPGFDWNIIRLATEGEIEHIEVDTSHFKGNFPDTCSLEACHAPGATVAELTAPDREWTEILPRTKLLAHTRHHFENELATVGPVTHVKFNIYPDGGVARLRLWGTITPTGRMMAGLQRLNALWSEAAAKELLGCCGSRAWANRMAQSRPFTSIQTLFQTADEIWNELDSAAWLEAFSAHPKIGERPQAASPTKGWSEQEQAGTKDAAQETMEALAEANRAYEAKYGFIFIVCATGKTAAEMLALCRARMENSSDAELPIAAEEQRRITHIRLEKLLNL
ncbi:MAG: allantoicase [Blastocatellia bacterium]|nr:allantoicase [Blastocatellia bacterium]